MAEKIIQADKSDIFTDLVEYTKLPRPLVLERCNYAVVELAVQWYRRKDNLDFYRNNELYLFDLTKYQMVLESQKAITNMIIQLKELGINKVLEFGGGIGEFSLLCDRNRIKSSYYDLDGKIKDYAVWRFRRHKSNIIILDEKSDALSDKWDTVNIMDVLEHIEDPNKILEKLAKNVKYIFCNPEQMLYTIIYPQHISKYDPAMFGFEKVEGFLWKNTKLVV